MVKSKTEPCIKQGSILINTYYSFKIFSQFWLAKSTCIIHHNQLLMTKFGRILCLTRKWCQKCSPLQVNVPLAEKTWGWGWVVLVVKAKMVGISLASRVRTTARTRRRWVLSTSAFCLILHILLSLIHLLLIIPPPPPTPANLDQEKIEFHVLFLESTFFFSWVSQFSSIIGWQVCFCGVKPPFCYLLNINKPVGGEQEWRSGESTRLPPMWLGFKSRRRHYSGLSLLLVLSFAPRGFSPGTL